MGEDIRFEWDSRKAELNRRKHGVRFEVATHIFEDPNVLDIEEGNDHGEIRFRAIGEVLGRVFFVSYTSFEEDGQQVIRIISARKASKGEYRAYQRHAKDHG
jgi:uncharacterized protein